MISKTRLNSLLTWRILNSYLALDVGQVWDWEVVCDSVLEVGVYLTCNKRLQISYHVVGDIMVVIGNPCKRDFLCLVGNLADRGAGKFVGLRCIR